MLIAYIPTTKLKGIASKAGRRCALTNLFHGCMCTLLGPLALYGETGLPMMSGDGVWRRCYPILASFVGDYPKQVLVTCTYYSECPKCYDPGPYHQFSLIFHHLFLHSQSLVPHSFPYTLLGLPPNHLTNHLMDHLTIPQSDRYHMPSLRSPQHSAASPFSLLWIANSLPRHDEPPAHDGAILRTAMS